MVKEIRLSLGQSWVQLPVGPPNKISLELQQHGEYIGFVVDGVRERFHRLYEACGGNTPVTVLACSSATLCF